MAAMVLAVDFMRYWVHRACHSYMPLWRLHEVHHSPDILYTLNVGRFHPFEKALHFACDSAPFLLLGVASEVLAGYFMLYAVNGFFQHSNLRLRYGWLNYVVGSAETHRWHHARDPKTAACNFGNTTIVWDLLFGTWYLPKEGPVDDIGIMDKAYPKGFWAQMLTPFRAWVPSRRRSFSRRLADLIVPLCLRLQSMMQSWRIARSARDPMRAQNALLARILRENRSTTFGRGHGFAAMAGYEDYANAVPVREFEALRPFIDAEIERGEHALTRERPRQYMRTSGSTGRPKDVPLTDSHLKALRRDPAHLGRVPVPHLSRGLLREHPCDRQSRRGRTAAERQILRCSLGHRRGGHALAGEGEIRTSFGRGRNRGRTRQVPADPPPRYRAARCNLFRLGELDDTARANQAVPRARGPTRRRYP